MSTKFKIGDFVICQKIENAYGKDLSNKPITRVYIGKLCQIVSSYVEGNKSITRVAHDHDPYEYDITILNVKNSLCSVHGRNLVPYRLKHKKNLTKIKDIVNI